MPKIKRANSVAEKTQTPDSVLEVTEKAIQEVGPKDEYLPDGHPNPNAWDVWGFMQELSEKDLWQHYIGYLYRVFPKHAPTDRPAYIAAVVNPLTLEMVRQQFGGKKYTLQLNRRVGTRQKQVYKEQFDIDAPVIWQDGEVPADGSVPSQRGPGRPAQLSTVVDAATGKRDDMLNKLLDDLIEQRNQAESQGQSFDAGEALAKAMALMNTGFTSALTSVTTNLGKGDNSTVSALTTLVSDLIKSNTARKEDPILQTLLNRALEKPEDPFEKITGILTLLEKLGIKLGSGRTTVEPGSEWAGVIEKIVDKAPELLGQAVQIGAQRAAANRGMGVSLPSTPAASRVEVLKMVPRVAAATTPSATEATASQPPPGSETLPVAISPELADRISQNVVKAAIVRMLFNGDSGDDAAHFAEMAHEPFARHLAAMLKANAPELQQDPILEQAMSHVNVLAFAQDYIAYFEEESAGASGEGEPASPSKPN